MKTKVFFLLAFLTAFPAFAEEGLLCLTETARWEQKAKIQPNLLSAIALVESGRFSKAYPTGIAWPWTVTAEGKGAFFASKQAAIEAVKAMQKDGVENIDVGCMQINLKFHPEAFDNLEDALDPAKNVAYAADFLKRNFEETKSWGMAAARYHSKTTHKAFRYEDKLLETWKRLTEHGNPGNPGKKAVVHDVSKQKAREINRQAQIAKRKNKAEENKQIQPGSEESKNLAAQWRKAKLEEYMARKKARPEAEPIFEDVRTTSER